MAFKSMSLRDRHGLNLLHNESPDKPVRVWQLTTLTGSKDPSNEDEDKMKYEVATFFDSNELNFRRSVQLKGL